MSGGTERVALALNVVLNDGNNHANTFQSPCEVHYPLSRKSFPNEQCTQKVHGPEDSIVKPESPESTGTWFLVFRFLPRTLLTTH